MTSVDIKFSAAGRTTNRKDDAHKAPQNVSCEKIEKSCLKRGMLTNLDRVGTMTVYIVKCYYSKSN